MFLYASKIAPAFLYPPGLSLLCLFLGAVLRKRFPRAAWGLFAFAFVWLWALSTHYVSMTMLGGLESRYAAVDPARAPQADVIVVLGGYLHPAGPKHPTAEMNEGADRLWMGARLYREHKAPLVLLTGGDVPMFYSGSEPEAVAAKDLLHQWGVPLDAIVTETQSRNTRENATLSKPILDAKGAKRLLLVTSAFHMPRAMAIFRRAGMNPDPVPSDYQTGWEQDERFFEFLPEAQHLYLSTLALHEWLGLIAYQLRGWA
ncbi:MAG: YdcF family protein [Acidobacteriaceae bacterium]|nr:YdcF family protein [Acidobacteriaceae bacterium]